MKSKRVDVPGSSRGQLKTLWCATTLLGSLVSCGTQGSSPANAQSSEETSTDDVTLTQTSTPGDSDPTNSTATSSQATTISTAVVSKPLDSPTSGTTTTDPTPTATTADVNSGTPDSDPLDSTAASSDVTTSDAATSEPPSERTAAELLAAFDLGWNLGNSLDVPEGETEWGNPVVDAALLQTIADAGFDVVRIPVTWSLFTGGAPSYTLEEARVNRVREVVDYALNAGLHAIINLHHDGADEYDGVEWLTLNDENGAISEANNQVVEERFRAVWTQLAEHFETFDDRLLFESMNEIHDGYDAPDPQYYSIINRLNQVFVDIVRGTGGNNSSRHLVVPGYNTNIEYTLAGFEAPQDPTPDHLILSVHFYDPWSFAGEGTSVAWGTGVAGADSWGQEDHVVNQFDQLEANFLARGLPMIIGEYGAVNVTGSESYRRYYMEYVTQAACQRGIVPIYWDNGGVGSGPDNFGLFNRASGDVVFPDILQAMFRGCNSSAALDTIARP